MSKKIIIADSPLDEDSHYVIGLQTSLPYYQIAYYIGKTLSIDFYRCTRQKVYYDGQEVLIDSYIAQRQSNRFFLLSHKDCLIVHNISSQLSKVNYILSIFSESATDYKTIIEEHPHFFITPIEIPLSKIQPLLCSINDYAMLPDCVSYPMYSL